MFFKITFLSFHRFFNINMKVHIFSEFKGKRLVFFGITYENNVGNVIIHFSVCLNYVAGKPLTHFRRGSKPSATFSSFLKFNVLGFFGFFLGGGFR